MMRRSQFKELLRKSINEVLLENRCWKGYEPVPGKEAYSKGSCRKKQEIDEGENTCNCGPDCECGGNCGSDCKCSGCKGNVDEVTEKDVKKAKGFRSAKKIQKLHNSIKEDLLELIGSDNESYKTMHYVKNLREIFSNAGNDELGIKLLKHIIEKEPEIGSLFKRTFGNQQN
jgi:hypothetical protein